MTLLLQDVFVTLFSIAAAATLATRLFGFVRPKKGDAACDRCATCPSSRVPSR